MVYSDGLIHSVFLAKYVLHGSNLGGRKRSVVCLAVFWSCRHGGTVAKKKIAIFTAGYHPVLNRSGRAAATRLCTMMQTEAVSKKTYCKQLVDVLLGFSESGKFVLAPDNKSRGGLYPEKGTGCFSLFGPRVLPEPTKADERKV